MIVKIVIIIIIIIITSATRMMVMIMILTTMITQHQFCKIGALKAERRGYFAEFFLREKIVKSSFIAILQFIIIFLRIDSLSGTTKMKNVNLILHKSIKICV